MFDEYRAHHKSLRELSRVARLPSAFAVNSHAESAPTAEVVNLERRFSSSLHETVLRQRHQSKSGNTIDTVESHSTTRRKSVSSIVTSNSVAHPLSPPPISITHVEEEETITDSTQTTSCISSIVNAPFENRRLYSPSTLTSTPFHSATNDAATPVPDHMQAPPDPHTVTFAVRVKIQSFLFSSLGYHSPLEG